MSYEKPGKSFNELKKSASEGVKGTNCSNCKFLKPDSAVPIDADALNDQGGLDPQSDEQMARAKKTDLITLPGDDPGVKEVHYCEHPDVEMHVTQKMCCAEWDHKDVKRPWEKS